MTTEAKIDLELDEPNANDNCYDVDGYKVIINKVDKEENLELCKNIANLCEKSNIDVVFTSYR